MLLTALVSNVSLIVSAKVDAAKEQPLCSRACIAAKYRFCLFFYDVDRTSRRETGQKACVVACDRPLVTCDSRGPTIPTSRTGVLQPSQAVRPFLPYWRRCDMEWNQS